MPPLPESPEGGLSASEAARRLARDGPNLVPVGRARSLVGALLQQFVHFFALLLWVAGGLAIAAGMPSLGLAIFVVVLVNGAFAFAQEWRADRAAEHLRALVPKRATVIRDGARAEVDAADVVFGDRLVLEAGDRVPADARVRVAHALLVDVSTLTGESVPTRPGAGDPIFAGTFVVDGMASAVVEATGERTQLARVASLTGASPHHATPLARELSRLVRVIAVLSLGVGLAFFVIGLAAGLPARQGFLFAIGVTVALVPEGLLPTVTLSLALGARRMAARRALVRRLEAVETLGSTTFICTDKTGTLTRNQMEVVEVWTPRGTIRVRGVGYEPTADVTGDALAVADAAALARVAVRCSTGEVAQRDGRWVAVGDPMEAAIDALARRLGACAQDDPTDDDVRFVPFDAARRRSALVTTTRVLVKGAPDVLLSRCEIAEGAAEALDGMTDRGLRVLAVAVGAARDVLVGGVMSPAPEDDAPLALLGFVALEDPPREGAREALAACRRAGIRVAMITGDHPRTAAAIARETALLIPGAAVVTGAELPEDGAVLGALLDRDGTVICRVTPEDKLRVARALRARGHVLAMTGDGVNDGPALREADIGVAMGRSGTDVAREAADLVLLDDDFATIVAAVEQGRATFDNARRCLTYHLSDNVAELAPFVLWAMSGGRFPLALGVLQILALDLVTDQLPALALGSEPAARDSLEGPPRVGHVVDPALLVRALCVLGATEAVMSLGAFFAVGAARGWSPGGGFPPSAVAAASGAAFAAIVTGQCGNAFACRSESVPAGTIPWTSNPRLVLATAFALAVLAATMTVAPLAALLGQAPPVAAGWVVVALAPPAVLAADGAWKRRRSARGSSRSRAAAATRPAGPRG